MEGIQFLQLNSTEMRWPCRPDAPVTFESTGSNLAKVIKFLKMNNDKIFNRWIEHVKTALPDLREIEVE